MASAALSDDIVHLLDQLKRIYKSHGVRYRQVAEELGICEKTMKRYMVGKGLTIAMLEKLCQVVGMSILDLAEIVNKRRKQHPYVSISLEEVLGQDLFTGLVFTLLRRGWDARDMPAALDVDPADVTASLVKLDRLGAIKLYPENRVKVLATIRSGARAPRQHGVDKIKARAYLSATRLIERDDPNMVWRISLVRLSPDKLALVGKLYDELLDQLYAMEDSDPAVSDAAWYQTPLFAGAAEPGFQHLK